MSDQLYTATPSRNSAIYDLLAAEAAEQTTWSTSIPAWHPRNDGEGEGEGEGGGGAQIDWESPDNPYIKRFQDTQAEFTRGQQILKDPQAFINYGAENGYFQVEQPEPGAEPELDGVDPYVAQLLQQNQTYEQRIAQLEARAQQENAAAGEELFHQDLDQWAEQAGVKLSKADHNAIFGALMQSPDPTQEQYAKAAFEAHIAQKQADLEAERQAWEQERKRPRIPTPPVNGQAATGTKPFHEMTREERDQWVLERVQGG